jgi:hypothetical protein
MGSQFYQIISCLGCRATVCALQTNPAVEALAAHEHALLLKAAVVDTFLLGVRNLSLSLKPKPN